MFKEFSIFKFQGDLSSELEANAGLWRFLPCSPTQEKSIGFAPPRGSKFDPLIESVVGQRIARVLIETKSVPADAIKKKIDEVCERIEADTGRKPGKKERANIKSDVVFELLPHAFPKTKSVDIWIDDESEMIIIGSTSAAVVDEVITLIVRAASDVTIAPIQTAIIPQRAMTSWLAGGDDVWPEEFSAGRYAELKADDETGSVVKFDRHHLDEGQMRLHISQGKLPTKLAINYAGRVDFVLTDSLEIKKVKLLDVVFEDHSDDDHDNFLADVALSTGELRQLIRGLIQELGGELK